MGSTFTVTVQVSSMDYFWGWDIYVQTNQSVINPISITTVGALFVNYSIPSADTLQPLANCVNVKCTGSPLEGPGVAHSAALWFPAPPNTTIVPPVIGTLFTITYSVVRAGGWSPIDIISSTFENGTQSQTGVAHTIASGMYGVEPSDFKLLPPNPSSLSVFQGSNVTTIITLESVAGFSGSVNLQASNELGSVFAHPTLTLSPGGTSSTLLTLIASTTTLATHYPKVTITASNQTVAHSIFLDVNVNNFPDFILSMTSSGLRIHAGNSANTTVLLTSQNGFSGYVNLTIAVPANVTVVLGSTVVFVPANGISRTSLNVSTPVLSLPFLYLINVTARALSIASGVTFQLVHSQQLIVKPPPPSFTISVNPSTIQVRAGLTSSVMITVRSVDYFWQYVYLSATMSGGAASFDSNSHYLPLPNSKYATINESVNFTLSVYVPIDQVPGHYIVLLSVYQNPLAQTIGIPVTITSLSAFHNSSTPTVLGLSLPVYFGILGFLLIPLIILGIFTYRRNLEDKDENWKA